MRLVSDGQPINAAPESPPSPRQGLAQPLGPEHLEAIALARQQARKIMRAASVAAFSGWTTAVFAIFTLLGGLFSVPAFLLGAALVLIAHIELKAGKGLRRFDLNAPQRLGFNQLGLWAVLTLYSGWSIAQALLAPGPYESYLAAGGDLANTIKPIARLNMIVTVAIYAALIVCSAIAQGGAALYYFTRRGHMHQFLSRTPPWIVQMLRAAAS